MKNSAAVKIYEYFLIGSFIIVLFAPLAGLMIGSQQTVSTFENRERASFPVLKGNVKSLVDFPEKFESYFKDHFGFRDKLIFLNNYIQVKFLGESSSKKILVGENGWLYTTEDNSTRDFLGLYELTPLQLESWKADLERKERWLAKQGIKYLFVIAPNKQTIYPENMPYRYRSIKGKTQLDQLREYLDNYSKVNIIDLRSDLLKKKDSETVYFRTDSHWNDLGIYVAYQSIMNTVSKWYPDKKPLGQSHFVKRVFENEKGKDLAKMLGLENAVKEGRSYAFKLNSPCSSFKISENLGENIDEFKMVRQPFKRNCKKSKQRVLILRDSFFTDLDVLVSEHFNQALFIWAYRPLLLEEWQTPKADALTIKDLIDMFKPDIVIEEKVERVLFWGASPGDYHFQRGERLLENGNSNEAIIHLKYALQLNPDNKEAKMVIKKIINYLYHSAFNYVENKDYEQSIQAFKRIVEISSDENIAAYNIACLYAKQNEVVQSVYWLKKSIEMGYNNYNKIKNDTDLESIRKMDDFEKIMKKSF